MSFTDPNSIVGTIALFAIPAFLIFALAFHLIFVKMIAKPTVNLFRKIQRKTLI